MATRKESVCGDYKYYRHTSSLSSAACAQTFSCARAVEQGFEVAKLLIVNTL